MIEIDICIFFNFDCRDNVFLSKTQYQPKLSKYATHSFVYERLFLDATRLNLLQIVYHVNIVICKLTSMIGNLIL